MDKLLVILGPTATGKTDLALRLTEFTPYSDTVLAQGELVSADSRQVYKGLDIGTGKLPSSGRWKIEAGRWIVNGIPIHMYDVVDPKRQYTVADYVKDANAVIADMVKRGKLPIVVGGTGLYLKALLYGLSNLVVPVDKNLKDKLEKLSLKQLQEKLQEAFPAKWKGLNESDRENPRRLVRAIELAATPLKGRLSRSPSTSLRVARNDILKIGLTAPREVLYQRVDEKVLSRIKQGMIEEAEQLHKSGLTYKRMRQLGLEYGVLADYLAGCIKSEEELIKTLQGKIHGYVRRQLTWFKKEQDVFWFDITDMDFTYKVAKLIAKWYHQADDSKNRHLS